MLSQFRVDGLHGTTDLMVSPRDDRLIVVGENGSGKSTLVNLIYYFITCQWHRLTEFDFKKISAKIGPHFLEVTHAMLERNQDVRARLRHISPSLLRTFRERVDDPQLSLSLNDKELARSLSEELHYPVSAVQRMLNEYRIEQDGLGDLAQISKSIRQSLPGQVLYLPTYRRIEHDLESIFRGIDLESQLRKLRERAGHIRQRGYLELVEFGMQDIDNTVNAKLAEVSTKLRERLSNLTASYLRDVIRGIHARADSNAVLALNVENLDASLARLDEAMLPATDKKIIQDKVADMQKRAQVTAEDSVIVHFLSKLLELQQAQRQEENVLHRFVTTCNRYLVGKQFIFDNLAYKLHIWKTGLSDAEQEIKLSFKDLSSGEKQIVSLFAHIYLSGRSGFFVIIDEPELSLSVPWQRHFLPDILATEMCSGLLAVTHSPFIFDNELEPYVNSMADIAEAARVPN
jgi:predicted ATPase